MENNGKHVNALARFHICVCVCNLHMLQNGLLYLAIRVNTNGKSRILRHRQGLPKESGSEVIQAATSTGSPYF